jgi:hypothetical protein
MATVPHTPHSFKVHLNITSHLCHVCYMLHPFPLPLFEHSNIIWRRVQVMKRLIIQRSTASCHFLPLRSKNSAQSFFSNTLNLYSSFIARDRSGTSNAVILKPTVWTCFDSRQATAHPENISERSVTRHLSTVRIIFPDNWNYSLQLLDLICICVEPYCSTAAMLGILQYSKQGRVCRFGATSFPWQTNAILMALSHDRTRRWKQ